MRLFALLALALTSAPAYADAAVERAVALVKQACFDPATPQAQMGASERVAQVNAWKLDQKLSGRKRGLVATPDDLKRPEMYESRAWSFSEPDLSGEFQISIITPEWRGWRQNGCNVLISALSVDDVVQEAKRQFGFGEAQSSASYGKTWVVSGGSNKSDEITRIVSVKRETLRSGEKTILGVYEFQAPADGAMPAPIPTR